MVRGVKNGRYKKTMECVQETKTNLQKFYEVAMPEDTNVIGGDSLRAMLYACEGFDKEEFEKPFAEVDFEKVAKSVMSAEGL